MAVTAVGAPIAGASTVTVAPYGNDSGSCSYIESHLFPSVVVILKRLDHSRAILDCEDIGRTLEVVSDLGERVTEKDIFLRVVSQLV